MVKQYQTPDKLRTLADLENEVIKNYNEIKAGLARRIALDNLRANQSTAMGV